MPPVTGHPRLRSRSLWCRLGMAAVGIALGISLGLVLHAARDGLGAAPLSFELGEGLGVGLMLTFAVVLAL